MWRRNCLILSTNCETLQDHRALPDVDDLIKPQEEKEAESSLYCFEGGDEEIAREVQEEIAIRRGEVNE
jgi:hypothetical protein